MTEVGYHKEMIAKVAALLLKKNLKKNAETQTLEDVVCLVFLEFYLTKFSEKYAEVKLIEIIQKTWKKMSIGGHKVALELELPYKTNALIRKALD